MNVMLKMLPNTRRASSCQRRTFLETNVIKNKSAVEIYTEPTNMHQHTCTHMMYAAFTLHMQVYMHLMLQ